jgi:hypothetical protein
LFKTFRDNKEEKKLEDEIMIIEINDNINNNKK